MIIVLEKYTGDDYDLVYCFDFAFDLLWKIKKPDSKYCGQKQLPYMGLSFADKICAADTL